MAQTGRQVKAYNGLASLTAGSPTVNDWNIDFDTIFAAYNAHDAATIGVHGGGTLAKLTDLTPLEDDIAALQGVYVNVQDYGAVGDGVTDDTAAVAAAVAVHQGRIVFPSGVYLLDDTCLQGLDRCILQGNGSGSNLGAGKTVLLLKSGSTGSLVSTADNARAVHLRDLDLDGQGNTSAGVTGFYINGASYCTTSNVYIHGFTGNGSTRGRGVRIHGSSSGQGYFNIITGFISSNGIGVELTKSGGNAPNGNMLLNTVISGNDSDGVRVVIGTQSLKVIGGESANNGGCGYLLDGFCHILLGVYTEGNTTAGIQNDNGTNPRLFIVSGSPTPNNIGPDYINCAPGYTFYQPDQTLTPATLGSGNNNDYEAGWANPGFLRLEGHSGGGSTITGLKHEGEGRRLTIVNISAFNITVNNEDSGSTASRRIITGTSAARVLAQDDMMELIYDVTSTRWRVVSFTT